LRNLDCDPDSDTDADVLFDFETPSMSAPPVFAGRAVFGNNDARQFFLEPPELPVARSGPGGPRFMNVPHLKKSATGLGIAAISVTIAFFLSQTSFFKTIEWKVYDLEMRSVADASKADPSIVMIEIDDRSVEIFEQTGWGRFPWPRDAYMVLLNYLERGRPRVITFDILFLEAEKGPEGDEHDADFAKATARLGNVVHSVEVNDTHDFPVLFQPPSGYRLGSDVEEHASVKTPIPALAAASRMLGGTFMILDDDGPVRRAVPFVRKGDAIFPSLAMATAMTALGLKPEDISLDALGLHLGSTIAPLMDVEVEYVKKIRTRQLLVRYKAGPFRDEKREDRTYQSYRCWELLSSEEQIENNEKPKIDPAVFKDKIIFVGTTAAGLHDLFQTSFGEGKMPGMQIHASVVDSLINRSFLRPAPFYWIILLTATMAILMGILGVYLEFWRALAAAGVIGLAGGSLALWLFGQGTWLPVVPGTIGLLLAQFSSVAYKYFVEDKAKRQVKGLFSRYVSPAVVKELIEDPSKARLGGARREMSVLFSDIRGFTTFSEAGKPEDVIRQLNEYFSRMVELLFEHHGTLDKFVGDMIMGIFNAPVLDPDHPDHAVQMGLAMIQELKVLNERWTSEGRPNFDIGVGINTGDMIVGNVGSERTLSYTVIGDNVNLGSRLESLNKQYESHIIISEFTRNKLKGHYWIRPLGIAKVKGKTRGVEIFEICVSEAELKQKMAADAVKASAAGLQA
jgi:adenylate cyclase